MASGYIDIAHLYKRIPVLTDTNGDHLIAVSDLRAAIALAAAETVIEAGYRKQSEGEWEIVAGSNGRERMVCTNCRHQQDLASTFTYCPNCGARMGGGE